MTRVRVSRNDLSREKADLAVCFAYEKDTQPRGVGDAGLRRELARQMKVEKFEGTARDALVWSANGNYPARRFLILGLGRRSAAPGETVRSGCARAARLAADYSAASVALALPDGEGSVPDELRAAVEGAMLGAYRFDRYLTDPGRKSVALERVEIAAGPKGPRFARARSLAQVGAEAVCLARDLVNEAPSRLTPVAMARIATRRARATGLGCKVLGEPELRKIGMSALLSVSRGSRAPSRMVWLNYKPAGRSTGRKRIVLVGKGVTFDSGGLNLKLGDHMLTMKSDMAGAAAVLATMTTLREIGCKAEVHGLLGLVENMTGADAYKPGDILDTYAGKTVEVGNTDAEGRLVLCDLLAWASKKLSPDMMVDVATLTGACVVALGTRASGLFTRDDDLREALLDSANRAGEKLWPLPMYEEYLQLLQKGPADLCNVGGRWGGASTAALFLGEFVPRELRWAHIDIAGPSFADNDLPEAPAGGTGVGVATLMRWLETVG